jgi:TonB family protein
MATRTHLIALLATSAIAYSPLQVQAEISDADALEAAATVQITVALAPDVDRDEVFVPMGKQEMVASLTVPERAPVATTTVLPNYPAFAQHNRLQGMVFARILVDASGRVAQIGKVKGHAAFHEAVKTAAAQWEFAPARQGKVAVKTWVTVPFSFEL